MYMQLQNHDDMDTGSNMSMTHFPLAGRHAWMDLPPMKTVLLLLLMPIMFNNNQVCNQRMQ